jgi:hypothetical protein
MADKETENQSKEDKKKEKAAKKALKKEAKEAKKKAKLEKKGKKDSSAKTDENNNQKKKNPLTIKKLILFSVLIIILIASGFFVYKTFYTSNDTQVEYKSVILKNVNLPDEMLEFSFYRINDLYFALVTYNLRVFLLSKEIERISKIGENYPDQSKIAEKEIKGWVKAKENAEKVFGKIEKQIKELYVLYNVNKDDGQLKIKEKSNELLNLATEALKTLDPLVNKLEENMEKEPQGFINKTLYKIKNIF